MKLLLGILALGLLVLLVVYDGTQLNRVAQREKLITSISHTLDEQGRERFLAARALSRFETGGAADVQELKSFQGSSLFREAAPASLTGAAEMEDWAQREALRLQQRRVSALKAEFVALDFTGLASEQVPAIATDWLDRFVGQVDALQKLKVQQIDFLSEAIIATLWRLLSVNISVLAAVFALGLLLQALSNRQRTRELQAVAEQWRDSNAELNAMQTILKSQAEDLLAERNTQTRISQQLRDKNRQMDLALDKLRQSNEQLERFAFICSHDLQEPVRMVLSFSQMLEKKAAAQLDDKALGYLGHITGGATLARQMISDILTFCRLDQNTDAHSELELTTVCEQVHLALQAMLEERQARFVWDDRLPSIEGVPSQLFQLFLNLVGNGIKFNRSAEPRVAVSAEDDGDCWRITVADNGIGIDPKYVHKLFTIFTRLNAKTEFPGTGIGLAICKKIVETHGAGIAIESAPDQGTRFVLRWPKPVEGAVPDDVPRLAGNQ